MDFALTDEQIDLRESVIRFAEAELNADVAERERRQDFYADGWQKCADFGLLGLAVPPEYGGRGVDPLTLMVAAEGLGFGCRDNGFVFAINNHVFSCTVPILRHGDASQKARYLPALVGARSIGGHAMTEPQSGSDASAMKTTAVQRGDKYVLNGRKKYITNATVADVFIVFARTAQGSGLKDISAFIVDKSCRGFSVGKSLEKMGLKTASMGELVFEDCEVPKENVLGGEGNGLLVFNTAVEWERCYLSASNLGAMKRQLEACLGYVKQRRQFGQPIGNFQAIAHKLADMKVDVEMAELMLYKVGWLRKARKPAFLESAMVKLFVSESYVRSSLAALEIHGAFGYVRESDTERQVRDSLASTIYAGTSEIQRNIIANWMGLEI
jgi:alkylation response protein AidB-like acyl-CoA dehydrogenase